MFIRAGNQTFIENDYIILKEYYFVENYFFLSQKGFLNLISLIKQFFFLVFNISKYDVVFIWFADYHAFLPILFSKIFYKKSILIIGGYDAEKSKEFNYGVHISKFRSLLVKKCCDLATKILPVSNTVYSDRKSVV